MIQSASQETTRTRTRAVHFWTPNISDPVQNSQTYGARLACFRTVQVRFSPVLDPVLTSFFFFFKLRLELFQSCLWTILDLVLNCFWPGSNLFINRFSPGSGFFSKRALDPVLQWFGPSLDSVPDRFCLTKETHRVFSCRWLKLSAASCNRVRSLDRQNRGSLIISH